jgi:hypothetical protein
LTLSEVGGVLTATFGDVTGGVSGVLDFSVTTDTSANLAASGQPLQGAWAYCGGGVDDAGGIADPVPSEATLNVTTGSLTYDSSTLFLSIVGEVIPPGPSCSGGQVAAAFTCGKE